MPAIYAYTHQRPDGNRYLSGKGDLPNAKTLDITLTGQPRWLVAAPMGSGSIWAAVLEDGTTQAFVVAAGQATETTISSAHMPSGGPPLLAVTGEGAFLVSAPLESASELTHPVPLGDSGRLSFIESGGDLVIWQDGAESGRLPIDALPDARLLVDDQGRVLLLTQPSTRYPHGIAGDTLEATTITLVATEPKLKVLTTIPIPGQTVVEGVSPIWTDLNGDGRQEIIVTQSGAEQGAQVVVYSGSGERIASGPAVGRGNRWRHQLAVGPFGAEGETELVEVLTPHIGGVAGFYRFNGDSLDLLVQQDGVTSHPLGTRNLDMGLAGDLDGDGQPELVVFNQRFSDVTALRRTKSSVETAWQRPVGGKAATNLAAVDFGDEIMLGVGREDGVLRIWLTP